MKLKVNLRWLKDLAFEAKNESGLSYFIDAEAPDGGAGIGPKPLEMVLSALAGCTGMDIISLLKKMQEPIDSLNIEVKAQRAKEHPKVFTSITLTYFFEGIKDRQKALRAVTLSQEKYCSVGAMLKKSTSYNYRVFFDNVEYDLTRDIEGVES